jgi:hypothetical protein
MTPVAAKPRGGGSGGEQTAAATVQKSFVPNTLIPVLALMR